MIGNVWEWCRDGFSPYAADNWRRGDGYRALGSAAPLRARRGGTFNGVALEARSSYRNRFSPEIRSSLLGVRPARRL